MTLSVNVSHTSAAYAEARRAHAAIKEIVIRHAASAADPRALRRVLALCEAASSAVPDAYCREKLRLVADYAAEMLAHGEHGKWGRDSASGAEFLRQQVLNALELFASRLYSLEALRRSSDAMGTQWTRRSTFAPS